MTGLEVPIPTAALPRLAICRESPLQGADVSPYLLLFLFLLLQMEGLHWPLHPDNGLHVVLKPVSLHVGISTLDLVEHPEESSEDTGVRAGGGGLPRGPQYECIQGRGWYLSHSLQGKTLWPSELPGCSGVRLVPVLGLELRMDSLL